MHQVDHRLLRINIGCGRSPTPRWLNFDSSPSVFIARLPFLWSVVKPVAEKLISRDQSDFIAFARSNRLLFGDATKGLPLRASSCGVVYASHVLEHLDAHGVRLFLAEVLRIFSPGGTLRLVVPDLQILVDLYNADGDGNGFVSRLNVVPSRSQVDWSSLLNALTGHRTLHQWIYNEASLSTTLLEAGFEQPTKLLPGQTTIPYCEELNLWERAWESLYMEARKPLSLKEHGSSSHG
ncbi:methyltransferase domain-containing protein [Synechococcus sp. CBW1004]|uniref:class I SAM-dependent methyltransferase n=1 Tax=Synechococcus sp. CBW1004 TaxID=1353136 RepID=UPI001E56BC23|nr:methyltransferase domain-containing protein [Synechococcus sp. CBW1004]